MCPSSRAPKARPGPCRRHAAPEGLPGAVEADRTAARAAASGGPALTRRALLVGAGGSVVVACTPGGDGVPLFMVSPQEEARMGLESWQRIRTERPASDNRQMQAALNRVGSNILAGVGQDPRRWEMVVFEGDDANAFALPGGRIGVYEGIFRYMENDAQLATVIGHEIGHNQERHAAERLSTYRATALGLQAVNVALAQGNIAYANEIAAILGMGAQYGVILPYSREQELEADRLGLINMARGGYDPRQSVAFWQNMQRGEGGRPGFLSTHPAPGNRIAQLQQFMPEAMAAWQR